MPFIVIDAGHGGWDKGVSCLGYHEKDIALSMANQVSRRLRELGFTVKQLRDSDTDAGSATNRGRAIAHLKPDFALSFHVGASGGARKKQGSDIIVPIEKSCSKFESSLHRCLEELKFCHRVYSKEARTQNIINRSSTKDFRFAESKESPDYYTIMREAWAGGIPLDIIELFYLDNEEDLAKFFNLEESYVEAVVKSLALTFNVPYDRASNRTAPAASYYRVVCGAYDSLEEARQVQAMVQKQFPNAWVQPVDEERR